MSDELVSIHTVDLGDERKYLTFIALSGEGVLKPNIAEAVSLEALVPAESAPDVLESRVRGLSVDPGLITTVQMGGRVKVYVDETYAQADMKLLVEEVVAEICSTAELMTDEPVAGATVIVLPWPTKKAEEPEVVEEKPLQLDRAAFELLEE